MILPDWGRGACRGEDPDMWYPLRDRDVAGTWAKRICARCPIKDECLDWALETGQQYGIWGGLTETERGAHRRKDDDQARRVARYLEWGWSPPRVAEWMGLSLKTVQRYQRQAVAA